MRFYAGFPTYYVRIAPHAMLTLIAQDFIKKSGWAQGSGRADYHVLVDWLVAWFAVVSSGWLCVSYGLLVGQLTCLLGCFQCAFLCVCACTYLTTASYGRESPQLDLSTWRLRVHHRAISMGGRWCQSLDHLLCRGTADVIGGCVTPMVASLRGTYSVAVGPLTHCQMHFRKPQVATFWGGGTRIARIA